MNDEASFFSTILADPDDATHRLVYADWLDEYGTTDQHRARSEWIRMTCWANKGKRVEKSFATRTRMAGEPEWLKKNAARLWPNLMAMRAESWSKQTHISLATGKIVMSVPLVIPEGGSVRRLDSSVVTLKAACGITTSVTVTFLRAAIIAPLAAKDEPFVPVKFFEVPERCYELRTTSELRSGSVGAYRLDIYRRPFRLRQLGGVWDKITLVESYIDHEPVKMVMNPDEYGFISRAEDKIDEALTHWARGEAANPLLFAEEQAA